MSSNNISYTRELYKDADLFRIEGYLLRLNVNSINKQLKYEFIHTSSKKIIIDLSVVTSIDSFGFSLLISLVKTAKENQKKIAVVIPAGHIKKLFEVVHFHVLCKVEESLNQIILD